MFRSDYDAILYEQMRHFWGSHPLNTDFAEMEHDLRQQLAADGIDAELTSFQRFADARYVGQGYELRVAMPGGEVGAASIQDMVEAFHHRHEAEYGHFFAESPIEIVNIRMTGVGRTQKIERPAPPQAGSLADAYLKTSNSVFRMPAGLQTFETKLVLWYFPESKIVAFSGT